MNSKGNEQADKGSHDQNEQPLPLIIDQTPHSPAKSCPLARCVLPLAGAASGDSFRVK